MTPEPHATKHWSGSLDLEFGSLPGADGRHVTRMTRCRHHGPLRVQRPFYPEGDDTCHVYLLHPPGGVVGGDALSLRVQATGGRVLLTTPGAMKLYRTNGYRSSVQQNIRVHSGAVVEWLPQETIAFDSTHAALETVATVEPGGVFVGWEICCLGRPCIAEGFSMGRLDQRFEVWLGGRIVFRERSRIRPEGAMLRAPWGLHQNAVVATMVVVGVRGDLASAARGSVLALDEPIGHVGCSMLEEVLVVRYLGPSVGQARKSFCTVWESLRSRWGGAGACRPRIWSC